MRADYFPASDPQHDAKTDKPNEFRDRADNDHAADGQHHGLVKRLVLFGKTIGFIFFHAESLDDADAGDRFKKRGINIRDLFLSGPADFFKTTANFHNWIDNERHQQKNYADQHPRDPEYEL